jgi:hypothetical protein
LDNDFLDLGNYIHLQASNVFVPECSHRNPTISPVFGNRWNRQEELAGTIRQVIAYSDRLRKPTRFP